MEKRKKRIYFRLKTSFPVRFSVEKAGKKSTYRGRAVDISAGGVGFVTNRVFQGGEILTMSFRLPRKWKKITSQVTIIRQVKQSGFFKIRRYMTGCEFRELEPRFGVAIRKYIAGKSRFAWTRLGVLMLTLVALLTVAAHACYYIALGLFLDTPFGKEWIHPGWNYESLSLVVLLHGLFGFGLAVACAGVFRFEGLARRITIILSVVGAIGQLFRLVGKIHLLIGGWIFQLIYVFEFFVLAVFLGIVLILVRRDVRRGFDFVLQRVVDRCDGQITPYDWYPQHP